MGAVLSVLAVAGVAAFFWNFFSKKFAPSPPKKKDDSETAIKDKTDVKKAKDLSPSELKLRIDPESDVTTARSPKGSEHAETGVKTARDPTQSELERHTKPESDVTTAQSPKEAEKSETGVKTAKDLSPSELGRHTKPESDVTTARSPKGSENSESDVKTAKDPTQSELERHTKPESDVTTAKSPKGAENSESDVKTAKDPTQSELERHTKPESDVTTAKSPNDSHVERPSQPESDVATAKDAAPQETKKDAGKESNRSAEGEGLGDEDDSAEVTDDELNEAEQDYKEDREKRKATNSAKAEARIQAKPAENENNSVESPSKIVPKSLTSSESSDLKTAKESSKSEAGEPLGAGKVMGPEVGAVISG